MAVAALILWISAGRASLSFADYTIDPGETYVMTAGETFTVDGSLIISATGTLDASAAGVTINVSEDWNNQGTFIPGTDSTVVLNGTGQQNVLGTSTFHNLTAVTALARTIGFEEDVTQTVNGAATFTGAVGQLLSLRTTDSSGTVLNDASQATIDFRGMESTDYLDVRDHIATSTNTAVTLPIDPTNSTNSGNTVDWFLIDTDGDGIGDGVDLDDDGDGIPDTDEGSGLTDSDGDGAPDSLDLDSDNDGINDVIEAGHGATDADGNGMVDGAVGTNGLADSLETAADSGVINYTIADTDGDGAEDYIDLDSDNDSISDLVESGSGGTDADDNGVVDGPDADGDGIMDSVDGNDAVFGDDTDPGALDTDGDLTPDYLDPDSDNDSILDIDENGNGGLDADDDGDIDNDTDTDNDGIADVVDEDIGTFGGLGLTDTDGDGVPNLYDLDDDGDGIPDTDEGSGLTDSDGDGAPDSLDLDSDNDGINDVIEAGHGDADADGNGIVDGAVGTNGLTDSLETAVDSGIINYTVVDTDGDGAEDYIDLDSDNDSISDLVESGSGGTDADDNGVVDGPDADGDGIMDSVDGNDAVFGDDTDPGALDTDGDLTPDYLDPDSDNDSILDIDENGNGGLDADDDGDIDNDTDTDNDGIADVVDEDIGTFGGLGTGQADLKTLLTITDNNGGSIQPGDTLTLQISVENTGDLDSLNTLLSQIIPPGTTYVANSTTLNGSPAADVSGTSPTVGGLVVNSPLGASGTVTASGAPAVVTLQVTVNANIPLGTSITAQSTVHSDQVVNNLSDDPNIDGNGNSDFEDEADVTTAVVGSAAILQTASSVQDLNSGTADPGDTLRYTVIITNVGNADATGVDFENLIPANMTYVPGSIIFNAVGQTDATGDDDADFNITTANTVTVDVGTVAASGGQVTITFDATIDLGTPAGTVISSQGFVDSLETQQQPTDADGNSANGYQTTDITVGSAASLVVIITVVDVNGGTIEPGDTLRYVVTMQNTGTVTATGVSIQNTIPANLTYTASTMTLDNIGKTDANDGDGSDFGFTLANSVTMTVGNIGAGSTRIATFDMTVDLGTPAGTQITNTVNVTTTNAGSPTSAVDIYVGGMTGKGIVNGNVFLDINANDNLDVGEELGNWIVRVTPCAAGDAVFGAPVYETTTDSSGAYQVVNLPVEELYTVQVYNPDGVFFGDIEPNVCRTIVSGENVIDYSFPIDPSGFIYDSQTGDPVAGAIVEFIDVSGGHGGGAGALVPNGDLVGTNTIVTDATGFYSFVLAPAAIPAGGNLYEIRVTPPAGYITSILYPPPANDVTAGLLDIVSSEIDAPAVGGGNVDDEAVAPFNVVGPQGAQYRYAFFVNYAAGETGEVFQNNIPLDPGAASLIRLTKQANKNQANVGSIVTYTVTLNNTSAGTISNVVVEDHIPPGFKYLPGRAILDGVPIADPTGTRDLVFTIGTVNGSATHVLKYQLIVGSGVSSGDYDNTAFARTSTGTQLSNYATEKVRIVPDAMFDLGTVIGKVFVDKNGNGVQDRGEKPVPQAQIMTEEGTTITTDDFGRYHMAGVVPGRHLFRLVESSLPEGATMTTRKVVVVDVTEGLPVKVNFGVQLPDGAEAVYAPFTVTQDKGAPVKRLNAALFEQSLRVTEDGLKQPATFRIFTNYHLFISEWTLQVVDGDTQNLIWEFTGNRSNIFSEIGWDGRGIDGTLISPDRNYAYRVVVKDDQGRTDITHLRPIVVIKHNESELDKEETDEEIRQKLEAYREWLEEESQSGEFKSEQIRVKGESVKVMSSKGERFTKIKILSGEGVVDELNMNIDDGLTAKDLLDSPSILEDAHHGIVESPQSEIELILPNGEYSIAADSYQPSAVSEGVVEGVSTDDTPRTVNNYVKTVKVGEDYMLFVAMGDAKVGYNTNEGDIEAISRDDRYEDGFWKDGKLAYYLKGKIKGKYLITSSLDTDRDRKELFRNLDPDQYYPVYGDESSVDFGDTDTQGMFYVLIEWDKSSVKWGNFNTGFTDTELAQFNRTLYGSKVHLERVATNPYGDSKTKLIAFTAKAQQKAAHNEFLGTGGSLFYLKHQDVIEGSEKVRLEVRDALTGLVLWTKNLEAGFDYSVDSNSGRVVFNKPVSMVAQTDLIVSTQLLEGNPVYVIVDYEYETLDVLHDSTFGARGAQALGDNVMVGGTYVKEEQTTVDYQLSGVDTKVYLGDNATVIGEYAETDSETGTNFVSTDGGLSFTQLATSGDSHGKAYSTTLESTFLDNSLGFNAYYKWIDHDFSTQATTSQQGKELIGFSTTYDFDKSLRLSLMHDIQRVLDGGNTQSSVQVGATKTQTTTLQAVKTLARMKITGEYRHQEVEEDTTIESTPGLEGDAAAFRVDYKLTGKVDAYVEQQVTFNSEDDNHQSTVGLKADINDYVQMRLEQKLGSQGSATSIGTTTKFFDKLTLSGDYSILTDQYGARSRQFGFGGNSALDDKFSLDSSVEGQSTSSGSTDVSTLSGSFKVDEKTELHGSVSVNGVANGDKLTTTTYGTTRKVSETLSMTTDKTYASSADQKIVGNTYGFTKDLDGRSITGKVTDQTSESATDNALSRIFEITGEINDQWAAGFGYERGRVNKLDGTQDRRDAISGQFSFLDKNSDGENRLKWANRIELRLDDGITDTRQHLVQSLLEGKANDSWTLFTKVDWSESENTTTHTTMAEYKEFSMGAAFRPVENDRLNALLKYSFIEDDAPVSQLDVSDIEHERFQVLAAEAIYDITHRWQLAEKFAYKWGEEQVAGFDLTDTQTWLWANRLNYRIDENWTVGAEYRYLVQEQAQDSKQGALIEVSRRIGDFIDVGAGYNFTDFDDDLTTRDYKVQGPYIRVTGMLYDRTPAEKAKSRERWVDRNVESWAHKMAKEILTESEFNDATIRAQRLAEYKNAIYQRIQDENAIEDLMARANESRRDDLPTQAKMLYREALEKLDALEEQSKAYPSEMFKRGFSLKIDKIRGKIQKKIDKIQ